MAQVDELDEGLQQLGQLMADLSQVVHVMRDRIASVDRLREPLKAELHVLKGSLLRSCRCSSGMSLQPFR